MQTYIKRIITTNIEQKLENMPGVVILGPRQCGKSTLAKAIISEIGGAVYLDLERPSDVSKLRDPEAFFSLIDLRISNAIIRVKKGAVQIAVYIPSREAERLPGGKFRLPVRPSTRPEYLDGRLPRCS